jgi:hypothetical protein
MSTEPKGKPANAVEAFAQVMDELARVDAKLDRLLAHLGVIRSEALPVSNVAPLSDIQGQYGDIEIKKDPKRWTGQPLAPIRASQCPPDYLDIVAAFLEWKAGKNDAAGKEKYAEYDRRDAARCRRWAIEMREGRVKQAPVRERDDSPPPAANDEYPRDDRDDPPPGDDDSLF